MGRGLISLAAVIVLAATNARATVTISNQPTRNMICSGGICTPTAATAVLNAGDLANALASGNVEITTTGSGVQANDLIVTALISWTSASTLTLDSYRFLIVKALISVAGNGGLSFQVNDGGSGGTPLFLGRGRATFANLASPLSIEGRPYTLVNSIASLVSAVAANSSGAYALANNYDALPDGTYTASPIPGFFNGIFEGLGNTISNLRVEDRTRFHPVGLFAKLDFEGQVNGLHMSAVHLVGGVADGIGAIVGGDAAYGNCYGWLANDTASGVIQGLGQRLSGGGLAGCAENVTYSSSSAKVSAAYSQNLGGLVGYANGKISFSYATGTVRVNNGGSNWTGGLVGYGTVENSYATGAAKGGAYTGGLAGYGSGSSTYSTGAVSGAVVVGGSLGDSACASTNDYWDTTTSGTDTGVGYSCAAGVTGLTTEQLQADLPAGFDPTIWAQTPGINNGFPYLIHNPPPQ